VSELFRSTAELGGCFEPVLDLDRTGMDWTGFRLICFGLD
jgi:hypothetical protein